MTSRFACTMQLDTATKILHLRITREYLTEKGRSLRQFHFGFWDSSASSGRMCRVSTLPDETAVQILCSIIHTLLKLHLKHFINTEARKLAIVHVATSFLTIQSLDRPISTFFTSYYSVLFTCLHNCGWRWPVSCTMPSPPPPFPIPTSALVWVFILLCLFLTIICIYIYI